MLKKITFLFMLIIQLITLNPALPQGKWELMLPPGPTSNQLVSLDFVDGTTGWAVGEYGTILKTTDAGLNWRIIEIPWLNYLLDVYFPTGSVGFAVGRIGQIIKTTDGGETWAKQSITYSNNLHRVRFRDENTGWIIGEKGLILHTGNGGANWQQQTSPSREDLNGIAIIDSSTLCIAGNNSTILYTTDNEVTGKALLLHRAKYGKKTKSLILKMSIFGVVRMAGWPAR